MQLLATLQIPLAQQIQQFRHPSYRTRDAVGNRYQQPHK